MRPWDEQGAALYVRTRSLGLPVDVDAVVLRLVHRLSRDLAKEVMYRLAARIRRVRV